jgi:DNA repair exonuclease SbcCD ATPase subunit
MNYISFKKLKIENFLSIGSNAIEIDLDNKINVITGRNLDKEDSKNGVGKSTIVDALYFALYGTTIRDIPKELIINSSVGKNCKVELSFTVQESSKCDEYLIVRTISPTKCTLFKNNTNITLSTMAKTNELLQSLLNCSGSVFQNSVVMSINSTTPFLAQSKVEKRKYIENILQLEVFSQMLLQARSEYSDLKHDYDITRVTHKHNIKVVEALQLQINVFNTEKQKAISDIEHKIVECNKHLTSLCEELKGVEQIHIDVVDYTQERKKLSTKIDEITSKIVSINNDRTEILTEQRLLQAQVKQLENKKQPCPTCKRAFNNTDNCDHLIVTINEKLKALNVDSFDKELQKHKDSIQKIKMVLDTLDKKEKEQHSSVNSLNNKITQLQTKIEGANLTLLELDKSLQHKKTCTNELLINNLNEADNNLKQSTETIDKQEEQLKVLDSVKFVLSEDGVKTFLIKKVLSVLNNKISQYLIQLEAPVKCVFNEFFDENITDEKGKDKSYFNFSGGERKRIDLACLFAFMDMKRLQGETVFNTTFYDELLDSSLDEKGVDLVLDVLRERNKRFKEGCYIITHRGQHVLSKIDSVIALEKRNGFTYILKNHEL